MASAKICRVCKIEKPLEEFYKRVGGDGRRARCRACYGPQVRMWGNAWAQRNREKIRARGREYMRKRLKDPKFKKRANENSKRYYYANKERLNKKRVWYGSKTVTGRATRRAYLRRRNGVLLSFPKIDYRKIREMYLSSRACFYCSRPLEVDEFQLDHYIPISRGGGHTIENIRISCQRCNAVKNSKDPEYFIQNMLPKIREEVCYSFQ